MKIFLATLGPQKFLCDAIDDDETDNLKLHGTQIPAWRNPTYAEAFEILRTKPLETFTLPSDEVTYELVGDDEIHLVIEIKNGNIVEMQSSRPGEFRVIVLNHDRETMEDFIPQTEVDQATILMYS